LVGRRHEGGEVWREGYIAAVSLTLLGVGVDWSFARDCYWRRMFPLYCRSSVRCQVRALGPEGCSG
jgi:hypothetical protein